MASPSHDPDHDPAPVDHDAPQCTRQPSVDAAAPSRPTLLGGGGDAVAFLDAPGLGVTELFDAVDEVLASMPDGAILTVFTDEPTAPHIAAGWAADRRVELLAVIPHSDRDGTTLTFRRGASQSGAAAPGGTRF
jgi:TusA-related sulfurtransferase